MGPTYTHPTPPGDVAQSPTDAVRRLVAMLTGPENEPLTLTRGQLAWLMATAQRWGYEVRVDEENASYPPPPLMVAGRWMDQADYRRRCDNAARMPRPDDYRGGPVEVWN